MKDQTASRQEEARDVRKHLSRPQQDAHERRVLIGLAVLSVVGLLTAVPFLLVFG